MATKPPAAPDRRHVQACLISGSLLVLLSALCASAAAQQAPIGPSRGLTRGGGGLTTIAPGVIRRSSAGSDGRTGARAIGGACVPATAPPTPGRFAGAKVNGSVSCSNSLAINFFNPSTGVVPDSLATGNLPTNTPTTPNDVAINDTWSEFGLGESRAQLCLDANTAGLITLSGAANAGSTFCGLTLMLASPAFAGCALRNNSDNTLPVVPVGAISAEGTVTIVVPGFGTSDATNSASWSLVGCPAPPPPPGPCANKPDGASCDWVPPEHDEWAARSMSDASKGTLVRSRVSEATAASIMAAARSTTTASTTDYDDAGKPCYGTCERGVCVLTPKAMFCCYADQGEYGAGAGGDDGYYAKAQLLQQQASDAASEARGEARVSSYGDDAWHCWSGY